MQKLEYGAADQRAGDRCRGVGRKQCVFHLSRVINVPQLILCTLPVFASLSGCGKGETTSRSVSVVEPTNKVVPLATQSTSSYNESATLPPSNPVIDVWNLKREVAKVEPLVTTDDTDGCYQEGDPEERESQQVLDARQKSEQACIENIHVKYAEYQRAREAFNKVWLPVMMDAIKKGDLVAEVIMRQCDITPVFDRSGIESSCDQDPQRRIIAAKRLREIGFAPAFDLEGEAMTMRINDHQPSVRLSIYEVQQHVLERFRQGAFNLTPTERSDAFRNGNGAQSDIELEEHRRSILISAAVEEVQRAFTYPQGFNSLSLNREPFKPGCLTWGRSNCSHGTTQWRNRPFEVYRIGLGVMSSIADQHDAVFMSMLNATLAAADANIDRYLEQDKRWSVFLLHRVGLQEWVPEGMESDTGKLEKEWQGEWKLEKVFIKWKAAPVPENLGATIYADGAVTRIRFRLGGAEIGEVPCDLRYSGGKTYLSVSSGDLGSIEASNINEGMTYFSVSSGSKSRLSSTDSPLGNIIPNILGITGFGPSLLEPFSPLDPKVQYPQVLVQCPQGEWPDSDRVRFLLRANDTLIEVLYEPGSKDLIMRQYRNSSVALPPKASPENKGDSIAQKTKTKPEPKLELSADSNIPNRTLVPIPTKREFQNVITPVAINHLPITLDPLGKWVYIMNNESNSVSEFKIKPISGGLTWVSTVQAGSYPSSMVINPSAKFAYVVNPHSNNISMYVINPDTGNLIPGTDFFSGITPQSLVMTPDGKFIYVAHANPGIPNVSMFIVNPLTGVTTSGPILEVKPSVTTLGIDPKGRFLFATSSDDNNVMAFAINRETGELTPGAITKTGNRPRGITVDPTGRFAYIVNVGSNSISEYSIDQKNGTLSSLGLVLPTQSAPTSLTLDRAGKYAYSTNAATDIIMVMSIDPDRGFLTLRSTVNSGQGPEAIVLDPKGHFAYVTNYISNAISIYSVDPLDGSLHPLDGSLHPLDASHL